ncbi:UNVERIFIED_CONTAM: hypothetical protein K2H54_008060 [Gekko kuhli]
MLFYKNSLEKAIMLGSVSGERKPGRQRTQWLGTVQVDTSLSMERLKETVQDQKTWRELAHRIAIMLGFISTERKPGRQRTRWPGIVKVDTSLSMERLKETVQDQKTWRELAHRIAIMLGFVSSERKPGRQRTRWPGIVKVDTSLSMERLKETVQDWKMWRELAHRITIMLGFISTERKPGRQRTQWLGTIKVNSSPSMERLKETVQDRKTWRELAHGIAIMLGFISGERKPGHQRTRWLGTVKVDTSLSMERLKETVQDRKTWRELAHGIAKSQTQLNG